MAERKEMPDWARQERADDMQWIGENMNIFSKAAREQFTQQGRGAIVVDTTQRPTGEGHPIFYIPQAAIEEKDDEDVKRMVREYDPGKELVLVLLKPEDRMSTYRINPLIRGKRT